MRIVIFCSYFNIITSVPFLIHVSIHLRCSRFAAFYFHLSKFAFVPVFLMSRIREIDGIRAIALLSVLIYHARFSNFLRGGFLGVDIFFVVSGYCITLSLCTSLHKGTFTLSQFFQRRVFRLMPALLVLLFISNLFCALIFSPKLRKEAANFALSSLFSLSNFHLWLRADYFDTSAKLKPYLHTWSLSVEWQFYLCWALISRFLFQSTTSYKPQIFIFAGITVISVCAAEFFRRRYPSAVFYLTLFRFAEFIVGAAPAWFLYRPPNNQQQQIVFKNKKAKNLLSSLSFVSIFIVLNLFHEGLPFPGLLALPVCFLTTLLILTSSETCIAYFLLHPAIQWLGKISYSVYLVHWPIFVLLEYSQMSKSSMFSRGIALLASIALGFLLYRAVEIPFQLKTKMNTIRNHTKSYLLAFLTGLLLLQLGVMQSDTLPIGPSFRIQKYQNLNAVLNQTAYLDKYKKFEKRHRCIATRKFHNVDHFDECSPPSKSEVLLMGDSHATDLWFALNQTLKEETILQITGTACSFGYSKSHGAHCKHLYSKIPTLLSSRINRLRAVIIASHWPNWSDSRTVDLSLLKSIIIFLKKHSKANIFVLSGRPEFHPPPHEIALQLPREDVLKMDKDIQKYVILNDESYYVLLNELSEIGAYILSSSELMCEKSSIRSYLEARRHCSSLNENRSAFIYTDEHHYNIEGARKLISKLVDITRNITTYNPK